VTVQWATLPQRPQPAGTARSRSNKHNRSGIGRTSRFPATNVSPGHTYRLHVAEIQPAPVRCSGRHRWNVTTGLEHRFNTCGPEAGASRCGEPRFTSSLQEGGGAQLGPGGRKLVAKAQEVELAYGPRTHAPPRCELDSERSIDLAALGRPPPRLRPGIAALPVRPDTRQHSRRHHGRARRVVSAQLPPRTQTSCAHRLSLEGIHHLVVDDWKGHTPRPQPAAMTHRWRWMVLAALLVAEAMNLLDATIVQVAAPTIHVTLGGSPGDVQWLGAAYTLPFALLLITGGRLGDILGRKRVFLIGVAGFGLASAACALAPNMPVLIGWRAVQGAAAALVIPQTFGLIRALFDGPELSRALGSIGPVMRLAAICGPALGALVTDADLAGSSWRAAFLINIPLTAGVLACRPVMRENAAAEPPAPPPACSTRYSSSARHPRDRRTRHGLPARPRRSRPGRGNCRSRAGVLDRAGTHRAHGGRRPAHGRTPHRCPDPSRATRQPRNRVRVCGVR
jgi:hypothetical protein